MLLLRSLLYDAIFYLSMLVMGIVLLPAAIWSQGGAQWAVRTFCRWALWLLPRITGLRTEIRGTVPTGEVLVASKHQSFLDIIILASALPEPRFIMKKELKWAPILGFYAMRMGASTVDRGRKGKAVTDMMASIEDEKKEPGQIIIYPEGTRVAPGVKKSYKIGAGVIYDRMGLVCHTAATNAGVFWGRKSMYRKPGLAVVEFLEPVEAGMEVKEFLAEIQTRIEAASDKLLEEAGYVLPPRDAE